MKNQTFVHAPAYRSVAPRKRVSEPVVRPGPPVSPVIAQAAAIYKFRLRQRFNTLFQIRHTEPHKGTYAGVSCRNILSKLKPCKSLILRTGISGHYTGLRIIVYGFLLPAQIGREYFRIIFAVQQRQPHRNIGFGRLFPVRIQYGAECSALVLRSLQISRGTEPAVGVLPFRKVTRFMGYTQCSYITFGAEYSPLAGRTIHCDDIEQFSFAENIFCGQNNPAPGTF